MSQVPGKQKGPQIRLETNPMKTIQPASPPRQTPAETIDPVTPVTILPNPVSTPPPQVSPEQAAADRSDALRARYGAIPIDPESSTATGIPPIVAPPPVSVPLVGVSRGPPGTSRGNPPNTNAPNVTQGSTRLRVQTSANAVRANVDDEDSEYVVVTREGVEDTTDWNVTDDCAVELTPNYTVNQMLLDINGSTGYSEDKAALATVPDALYLQITDGLVLPPGFEIGRDPFCADGVQQGTLEYQRRIVLFLWANTRALLDAGLSLSNDHAVFLAYLRLQVVLAGGTARILTERSVYVDEYAENFSTFAEVDYDILPISKLITGFLNDHWLQYVALLRHLFVTRGHHYKREFSDLITKTWSATTIKATEGLAVPEWRHILRTGLHCFGIRALNILTIEGFHSGVLAKSFETRIDAAPAGAAYVRTGWAVLESMQQAQWYPSFYAAYQRQIEDLRADAEYGHMIGLRAHINAKLFNWRWSRIIISDASVRALAPLFLGFLDTLERGESLRGQKTLNKRGDGGSALRAQFSGVLINEQRNAKYMETAKAFFEGYIAQRAGQ